MLVLMLMSMLMSHASVDLFVLSFCFTLCMLMLMSAVKTRLKLLTVKKCDFDRQFLSHSYLLNFSSNFTITMAIKS